MTLPSACAYDRARLLWAWPLAAATLLVVRGGAVGTGIGVGIVAYVAAYVLAHDGVAHGRLRVPAVLRRSAFLRRVAHTHRLHHRGGRAGAG